MKKILSTLLAFTLIIIMSFNVIAAETSATKTTTESVVEDLGDGYYLVETTTIIETSSYARVAGTKNATRTYDIYDSSNDVIASFQLSGNFHYTGSSSTCLVSSYETKNYKSSNTFTNAESYCSGKSSVGEYTYKIRFLGITTKTISATKKISCDSNGNISYN